jgi:hypothetical protein
MDLWNRLRRCAALIRKIFPTVGVRMDERFRGCLLGGVEIGGCPSWLLDDVEFHWVRFVLLLAKGGFSITLGMVALNRRGEYFEDVFDVGVQGVDIG